MGEQSEKALSELGLPRANSNALLFAALIIISVFGVMAYSCTRERKGDGRAFDAPPQPLSGNEWFVGKGVGIDFPKPEPMPQVIAQAPPMVRPAHGQGGAPRKLLGGKVYGDTENRQEVPRQPEENDLLAEDYIASFDPGPTPVRLGARRPEYYLERDVETPISDFEIKAGTAIPAQLDMGINSDLGGPGVAHITRTIYDTVTGQFPLIPPGTKLYGNINPNVSFGQTRVDVVWERLIFPNGASLVVQNMRASDRNGQLGLYHTVDNHYHKLFGGAILLSAISSGVQLSQPQQSANFGSAPSVGQTLAATLGQNLGQVSTELIRRQMDVKPTIIIPNAEHFTVIVNKDMVFPGPYGTWD